MPIIRVEMLAGRSLEQKRALAAALTREMAAIAQCSPASIHVVIEEVAKDNWAVGGTLMADKNPA